MNLLVAGGTGYLGGRFAEHVTKLLGWRVILGGRTLESPPAWMPEAHVMRMSWHDAASLERACEGVDAVVHLAGLNARECRTDPVAALEVNGLFTARLVRAAIKQNVRRFIYVSTAHVYRAPLVGTLSEWTCPASLHPYGSSHRAGEDAVRDASMTGRIEAAIIRLANTYGRPMAPDRDCWSLVVNDAARQAVVQGCIGLNSAGKQKRDFLTATEACGAIAHLLQVPAAQLLDGVFNVGSGTSCTVLEMVSKVALRASVLLGREIPVRPTPGSDDNLEDLDYRVDRIRSIGFVPRPDVSDELDQLIGFCMKYYV